MKKINSIWATGIVVLIFQGCAIVGSERAVNGGQGIAYMLPRALLPIELVYDGSAFELRITNPVLSGDKEHTYLLRRSGNIFTSDNVTVNVDPATGLLSAIDVKSDDKTIPAIIKLFSGLRAENADAVKTVVVFRGLFDPGWGEKKVEEFNQLISAAAKTHVTRLANENGCKLGVASDPCKGINMLIGDLSSGNFKVEVEGAAGEAGIPANCTAGFCYRINVPHVVTLIGPGTRNSAVFGLPNRSPTFVMALERWAFVKTTHDVKLEGGVFKSITSDRPSSALAVAEAPLALTKGVLGAISEVFQLRIDVSGKEKALADAKVAEIASKAALEKALLDKTSGKAEAAILGLSTERDGPLLSIRIGNPSQLDATKNLVGVKVGLKRSNDINGNPLEIKSASGSKSSSGSNGNLGNEKK